MQFKFLPKSKISQLPKTSGVYAFKKGAELLYIGKAQNIRERIKQHEELLGLAEQLGYIKTDSEIEALVLEAQLIKKHQPKFNVVWKDDKNYFYICITGEALPRIFITHQCNENRSRYIGPFVEGKALKETLRILRKVFPYYAQKRHPKGKCLWCHLNLCPGPNPDKKEYQKNIKKLIAVLKGKKKSVLKNLKKEMELLSRKEKFEEAARIKNQAQALEKIISYSHIFDMSETEPHSLYKRIEAYDISDIQGKEATGSMVVFINGKKDKSQYRKFKIKTVRKPNDVAMLKEVLKRRLKHKEWPYPDLILIDGGIAQLNAALQCLEPGSKHLKVMALAKRDNELFIEGKRKPVLLKKMPRETFNLILQLGDEAHRFARAYHHKLRKKHLLG